MISYYSPLKLWILPINGIEVILRSSHWRRSANIFEYVFFKVANLQSIQLHLCSKSMENTCEGVQLEGCYSNEKLNSFAGIFLLVLAQLQNWFFVEYFPVAAYVRCLKEKEWKKGECFYCTQSDFFFVALQGSIGEIRTN